MRFMRTPGRLRLGAVLAALVGALVIAACGSSSSSSTANSSSTPATSTPATSTPSSGTSTSGSSVKLSSCGQKPGVKATGTPIPVGSIDTKQSGTDFTDIQNMEAAYFACVNDNGGINGHPIKLFALTEQTQPSQIIADAHQLVQTDHVVAVSGNTSIIECSIDHKYWEQEGYKVIADGIAPECYSTPNYADGNRGARFGSDAPIQYLVNLPGIKKIVFDQSNVPGTGYIAAGVASIAKAHHIPMTQMTTNVPITDANSVALKLVDAAGPDGAVALNFTPPETLPILQAVQKLGLQDRVKAWACGTTCNTDFLAKALGPKWANKFFITEGENPPDDPDPNTPQMQLYKAIYQHYGTKTVSGGIGSFSEMGFIDGEILVHALESMKPPYTKANVNKAIENVKNFDTGMKCYPWTYGPYPMHLAAHGGYVVTPDTTGHLVLKQGCRMLSPADPLVAAYYKVAGITYSPSGKQ